MAVDAADGIRVTRLLHVRLCCARAWQTADFYESALGFQRIAIEHLSGARAQENFGIGGRALRITLALGMQRVTLVQFIDRPGNHYPADAKSSDLIFHHFAIVVADMASAMAQLQGTAGWTSITQGGPQQLPPSSGGVTAFKFRDPEGHPLELLAFPHGRTPKRWQNVQSSSPFLGIDHSAINVRDAACSVVFYQSIGFTVAVSTINEDAKQAMLDHLDQPVVEVIGMNLGASTPHIELLCYRDNSHQAPLILRPNDVAASCLVFATGESARSSTAYWVDPDGHHFSIQHDYF